MVTATRLTLEEYLALPETKPYLEYVRGELAPKAMPNDHHSRLVARLIRLLGAYLESIGEPDPDTELRHLSRAEHRGYLPDVSVTLRRRRSATRQNPVEIPPDLAIEVLSPDDRVGDVLDKADFYMRIGVPTLWIVDPENRAVTAYHPAEQPHLLRAPESLDASPALPGFSLPLADLFSVIEEPEDAAPPSPSA